MKRFKVTQNYTTVFRSETLIECVDWVRNNEPALNSYYIEDIDDEIEVDADEVLQAFDDGEYYLDLQGF